MTVRLKIATVGPHRRDQSRQSSSSSGAILHDGAQKSSPLNYLRPLLLHHWFSCQSIRWCHLSIIFIVNCNLYYLTCILESFPFKDCCTSLQHDHNVSPLMTWPFPEVLWPLAVLISIHYLCHRLVSRDGIVTIVSLGVCVCVCPAATACRISLDGKGNALYPVLSSLSCVSPMKFSAIFCSTTFQELQYTFWSGKEVSNSHLWTATDQTNTFNSLTCTAGDVFTFLDWRYWLHY